MRMRVSAVWMLGAVTAAVTGASRSAQGATTMITCTSSGSCLYGHNKAAGVGYEGRSTGGVGLFGDETYSGMGALGVSEGTGSTAGAGVYGLAGGTEASYPPGRGGIGVMGRAVSAGGYGVAAQAPGTGGAAALYGNATGTGGTGVYGTGAAYGVHGYSSAEYGVEGQSSASGASAVLGEGDSSATGVYGFATSSGYGVYGHSNNDAGHFDSTGSGHDGVWASGGYAGVYATGSSYGLYATCTGTNCYAGYFSGEVTITGCAVIDGTTYPPGCSGSDRRLKRNIESITDGLGDVLRLKPVTYEWVDPTRGAGVQTGFIAQDVEQVRPDWVSTGGDGYKRINMERLPTLLVASVQTLESENRELQDRLDTLEAARHPAMSGFGGGWMGTGIFSLAAAIVITRRRRSD